MEKLNYYCYVSRFKVNQLYEQLSDFSVEEASLSKSVGKDVKGEASVGGLFKFLQAGFSLGRREDRVYEEKGVVTTLQKLKKVLNHLHSHERIIDLNDRLDKKLNEKVETTWFLYKGTFNAEDFYRWDKEQTNEFSSQFLIKPGETENKFREVGPNNGSLVSNMCILHSNYSDYKIQLACSLKYFSDMGGSWSEESKEWHVNPHSGNHHFFRGSVDTVFETLIFVNGIKDKKIMGTPLFSIHSQYDKNHVYL